MTGEPRGHTHPLPVDLDTLAARVGGQDVFDQLVFLAGRKLGEESPVTQMLSEVYPRLVVTPPAWFEQPGLTKEQLARGRRMNLTALRESRRVLRDGRLLFLFPTGTRERPGRPETRVALSQTANYLRMVKNVCLLGFRGNTLPPHESAVRRYRSTTSCSTHAAPPSRKAPHA